MRPYKAFSRVLKTIKNEIYNTKIYNEKMRLSKAF